MKPAFSCRLLLPLLLAFGSLAPVLLAVQRELPGPQSQTEEKFFEQLRSVFGRFREQDLRRTFETARPVECSDLTSDTGEWRPVAFFNEDRKLGDWYYRSLDEVKAEFSVFTFRGDCKTNQGSVQLVTKFPVRESLERYAAGRINLRDVRVVTNAPVPVSFNPRFQSYRFELPYMYAALSERNAEPIYTLYPPHAGDHYAVTVSNHWDCKSVRASDVTFQFLICETATLPREIRRGTERNQTFGTYAYFILSDGKEAMTSVKLSFGAGAGDDNTRAPAPAPERAPALPEPAAVPISVKWQVPGTMIKLLDLAKGEFRLRFTQAWADKVASGQLLSAGKMSPLGTTKLSGDSDYCAWRPAGANFVSRLLSDEPDLNVAYSLTATNGISFDMKTHTGSRIGTLQCAFRRAEPDAISVERWNSVVGEFVTLEVNP